MNRELRCRSLPSLIFKSHTLPQAIRAQEQRGDASGAERTRAHLAGVQAELQRRGRR